jgi:hypothetical protein
MVFLPPPGPRKTRHCSKSKVLLSFFLVLRSQILANARTLEEKYGDMMDIEFSVQDGVLYMLQVTSKPQTLNIKRTGPSA